MEFDNKENQGSPSPTELQDNTTPVGEVIPPVDATITPVIEPPPPPPNEENKLPPVKKENNRLVLSIAFSGDSADYVRKILQYHLDNGLAANNNDFGVKIFDTAINLGAFTKQEYFGRPDELPYKLIKDGSKDFATVNIDNKLNIPVCK